MTETKKKKDYINNADFVSALIEHKKSVKEAEINNSPIPRLPNYIGECFLKIATHVSYKPNFVNTL